MVDDEEERNWKGKKEKRGWTRSKRGGKNDDRTGEGCGAGGRELSRKLEGRKESGKDEKRRREC